MIQYEAVSLSIPQVGIESLEIYFCCPSLEFGNIVIALYFWAIGRLLKFHMIKYIDAYAEYIFRCNIEYLMNHWNEKS